MSYLEKGRKRDGGKDDWKNLQTLGKFGKSMTIYLLLVWGPVCWHTLLLIY